MICQICFSMQRSRMIKKLTDKLEFDGDVQPTNALEQRNVLDKRTIIPYYIYAPNGAYIENGVSSMNNESFSEKVSVNINTSTLSSIDLLVDHGYYSNRSDFINQALREGLQKHQNTIDRLIDKKTKFNGESPNHWFIGVYSLEKQEIDLARKQDKKIEMKGYGVLIIDGDIDEETLFEVVPTMKIKGKVVCKKSIKEHYGLK